jgi:hypothetical protein
MKAVERPIINMRDTRHVQEGYEDRYSSQHYNMDSYQFFYTSDIAPLIPAAQTGRLAAIFDVRSSISQNGHQPEKLLLPQKFAESMGVLHFFTCWHPQGRGKGKNSKMGNHRVFITQLPRFFSC